MGYFSASSCSEGGDSEKVSKSMRDMLGPQAVDQAIRQAIHVCWMILPDSKRNAASVESEIRRTVERALENLREDASAFGIPDRDSPNQ
jgi:histone H3/H4